MKSKFYFSASFLAILFFLSGACGLSYEVVWVRQLGLIFGNTTLAISTALAAFMGGLGLGSYFFGRRIDKKGNPLQWYALLEISIGIFCLFTPFFWTFIQDFYVWAYQAFRMNFWQFSIFRFFICFAILFVPTFLMGGSLPVLTKFLIRDGRQTATNVGLLYGVNTLGAVLGVLFTSFFAIYCFGLEGTVFLTAGLNILIGLTVLFFVRLKGLIRNLEGHTLDSEGNGLATESSSVEAYNNGRVSEPALIKILLISFAFCGFTSMAYELCWTRVLALCLGSSVYSFAVMLASFLTGLGLGSILIGWLSKRIRISYSTFALAEIFVAFFVLWGISLFDQMPIYFLQLFSLFGENYAQLHIAKFFLASIVILPPTIFIGCTFAIVVQILNRSAATTGKTVGYAYLINTLGCILGSVIAGFVLVPWIGIYKTFIFVTVINFLIGTMIFFLSQKKFLFSQTIVVGVLIIFTSLLFVQSHPWSRGLLTSNIAINPRPYLGHSKYEILGNVEQDSLLYYKEGLGATVAVRRNRNSSIVLSINANFDASSGLDMYTQLMLGHLPTLFAQNPKRALVIGMGSGVTLGALASYPSYQQIHCAELESAVVGAAHYFSKVNRNVLDDPRLKNFINDGRNHLLVENFTYDVIVSEPSSPWMAGVATLFTREQFELMKKRLAPGGVVCQWINIYSMSPQNIQMIIKTFRQVFPYASLWQTIKTDLLLVGSTREIVYDPVAINKKINENKFLQKDLADFNISDASGLLSCFLLADNELAELSKDGFVNSDNFPFLEYFAPLNLYGFEKTVFRNWEMLVSYRQARYPKMTKAPRGGREKIDFHNAIARGFIQKGSYQDAEIEIGLANREEAFNKGALLNYGIFSAFFGKADEAIANLESYLKQDPLNAEANFYIAKVYDFKQNFDQALPHYQTAAQQEPKNDEYLFSYAQSLMRSPDKQKAIGVLQKVVELAGLNIENGFALSEAFVANQQFEPAIKTLRLLSKEYPSFYGVYEEMARFYDDAHQYAQGLLVCREAQARFPFNARNYYLMSNFYEKLGNAHEARKMARIYSYYQNAPKIGISE